MATLTPTSVFLGEFETRALLELEPRGPGTYSVKLMVRCNSLLSSLYIKTASAGATVKVNYFDTTTGTTDTSERYDLLGHDIASDADVGETFRILVPKIHNKPQLEVIVTGTVEFGVYATAVSTSASDIDSALVRDGDTFIPTSSKGMPFVCLNRTTGLLEFVSCPLPVTIDGSLGDPFFLRGKVNADPGNTVTVISDTVPALTTRKIKSIWVTSTNDGDFSLEAGGIEIAAGYLSNVAHNVSFNFDPPRPISAGVLLELKFIADAEPSAVCPVTAFLSGNDVT